MIKSGSKIFRKLCPHAFHRYSRKFISQWNVTTIGPTPHKFETRLRLERRMLSRNNLLECPIFIFLVRSTLLVIAYDSCIRTIDRQSDVISIALHCWDSCPSKFLVQGCFWTMTHVDAPALVFFSRLRNTRVTWPESKRIYLEWKYLWFLSIFTIRYVRLSFSSVETIHICPPVNESVIQCYFIRMKKFKKRVIEWWSGFYYTVDTKITSLFYYSSFFKSWFFFLFFTLNFFFLQC